MVLPDAFKGDYSNVHYFQGVIIAQVAVTLALYIILRIVHYVKWGADQQAGVQAQAEQKPKGAQGKKQQGQEDATTRKWEQKVWDVYFPIIYTNHMACLSLSLCYIPYIFEAIFAYIHFACFCAMIIVNIFVKDSEPGTGNRTRASRILWLLMCVTNIVQLIAGLTGVAKVLP